MTSRLARRAGEPRGPVALSTPQRLTSVMSRRDDTGLPPPTADNGVAPSLWGAFLGSVEVEQHPWSPPTQCPGVTTTDVPRHHPVSPGGRAAWGETPVLGASVTWTVAQRLPTEVCRAKALCTQ